MTSNQIQEYRQDGYIVLRNFLKEPQLQAWRAAVDAAVEDRGDQRFATGEEDKTNVDEDYYQTVFT